MNGWHISIGGKREPKGSILFEITKKPKLRDGKELLVISKRGGREKL